MQEVSIPQKRVVAALALIEARKLVRIAKYNAALALAGAMPKIPCPYVRLGRLPEGRHEPTKRQGTSTGWREQSCAQGREEQLEHLRCLMREFEHALARCDAAKSEFEDACGNNGQGMATALAQALQQLEVDS
jgi:hypothetical protein